MDIRILRDGIEIGPFPEETVQTLLQQGNIAITDLAWCPGMPQWVPLANLLYATNTPPPPPGSIPPPPPAAPPTATPATTLPQVTQEPATPKQKAFLTYMGVSFTPEIDREAASHLVNEAMENPKDSARLARWNRERLKLHPDLFATEIQAAKEQRAQHFFEVCETQGSPYFSKVTKAHCQVLVGYLDVHYPNWDADEREATTSYFFPAIAEKFPQLLNKEAKGRFKYPEGPKVAKELAQRSPVAVKARRSSPAAALARGVFFGLLILGMLWFVKGVMEKGGGKDTASKVSASATPPAGTTTDVPATVPPVDPNPALAQNPPADPPATTPGTNPRETTPTGTAPAVTMPETTPTGAPTNADPIMAAVDPSVAQPQPPPPAPAGTALLLTKPIEVQAKFGKIKLPAGTPVKLIQQNGAMLTVQVPSKDVVPIPASSTNLGSIASDAPATLTPGLPPPPVAPAPITVAPTPAPPAPAGDSLFGPPPTTAPTAPGMGRANPSSDL